ncbi:MAG: hypothetical protein K0Q81_1278 [Paenibacillus sp.]|jgi:hypothetical protein|nr:hypothetical protein [Paenibacillus sp.]
MKVLAYRFNKDVIQIRETGNDSDVEFVISLLVDEPYTAAIKEVQHKFDENRIHTDVLFYAYENHQYRIIVRQDYYNDFILELLRHQLLESAEWV